MSADRFLSAELQDELEGCITGTVYSDSAGVIMDAPLAVGMILDALSKAGWAFIRPSDEASVLGGNVVQAHPVIRQIAEYAEAIASQAGVGSSETAGVIVSFLWNRPSLMPEFMAGTLSTVDVGMLDHHNGTLSWHGQDGKIYDPDPSKARFAAPAAEVQGSPSETGEAESPVANAAELKQLRAALADLVEYCEGGEDREAFPHEAELLDAARAALGQDSRG